MAAENERASTLLAWIGAIAIAGFVAKSCSSEDANNALHPTPSKRSESSASTSHDGLPIMLDRETMITSMDSDATSTTYQVKMINHAASDFNQDFLGNAQELIGRRNCADSDISWSYDQGMISKYVVSGSDDRRIGSFVISKHYCSRFR